LTKEYIQDVRAFRSEGDKKRHIIQPDDEESESNEDKEEPIIQLLHICKRVIIRQERV